MHLVFVRLIFVRRDALCRRWSESLGDDFEEIGAGGRGAVAFESIFASSAAGLQFTGADALGALGVGSHKNRLMVEWKVWGGNWAAIRAQPADQGPSARSSFAHGAAALAQGFVKQHRRGVSGVETARSISHGDRHDGIAGSARQRTQTAIFATDDEDGG